MKKVVPIQLYDLDYYYDYNTKRYKLSLKKHDSYDDEVRVDTRTNQMYYVSGLDRGAFPVEHSEPYDNVVNKLNHIGGDIYGLVDTKDKTQIRTFIKEAIEKEIAELTDKRDRLQSEGDEYTKLISRREKAVANLSKQITKERK